MPGGLIESRKPFQLLVFGCGGVETNLYLFIPKVDLCLPTLCPFRKPLRLTPFFAGEDNQAFTTKHDIHVALIQSKRL